MLAWMMVDEGVAYLCPSTVYRILDNYDLLYRWKRGTLVGTKPPIHGVGRRRYVVEEALEKTPGAKPKVVTDRGSQFTEKSFINSSNATHSQR